MASKSKKKDTFLIKDSLLSMYVQQQYNTGVIATTSYAYMAQSFNSVREAEKFIDSNHLDGFIVVKK